MNHYYSDIREKLGQPLWWDEVAVPRYIEFSPDERADVYAVEVVLLLIQCQNCHQQFKVAMSKSTIDMMRGKPSLADQIRDKSIHYGDPPNDQCCPSGPTMNSEPLRVLEYWRRSKNLLKWERDKTLEVQVET